MPLPQKPDLGPWRAGNTGVEGVWRIDSGRPGRALLVTAAVHGNEVCGVHAALAVLRSGLRPAAGTLTLAFCNLEAFDRADGTDAHRARFVDEDLNRVWGPSLAAHGTGSSERRRATALRPFVEGADWLLDLHSMHEAGAPMALTGPHARNAALVRAMGAPATVVQDAGHAAGRRLRDHGAFGEASGDALAVLVECGFHADPASGDVALDVVARFLERSGAFAAGAIPAAWRRPTARPQRTLRVTDAVTVPEGEPPRFTDAWVNGQTIAVRGTPIATAGGRTVATPYDRCVLVMPTLHHATPGATLVRLAEEVDPRADGGTVR